LAQEAFVRLNRRGQLPDRPDLWLMTVALNLFRNARSTGARRRRLLTPARAEATVGDPGPSPIELVQAAESRERVRMAIDQLPERDRQLLLLRAEGYSYRDLAMALGLKQESVGTLLARAKRGFREAYGDDGDAS
jgi:RNA polymerase sigma factor (sigma-70 family)